MSDKLNSHDKLSLALHAAVKQKLIADPEYVINTARRNLERWRKNYDSAPAWMYEWNGILDNGVSAIIKALEAEDEISILLRSSSPFTGILSEKERGDILRKFKFNSGK